jgi:O-antigen ligase
MSYLPTKSLNSNQSVIIQIILLTFTSFNIGLGLHQFINGIPPIGFFDNSGIYSIYLCLFAVLSIGIVINNKAYKKFLICWHIFIYLTISIVIILTQSRTAMIALTFGSVLQFVTIKKYRLNILKIHRRVPHTKWALIIITLIIFLSSFKLYSLKKDSADGRILIWKTSLTAISEKPLLGHGTLNYQSVRAQTQTQYFQTGSQTEQEERLAGTLEFAFNDFLQITVESGILGLILLITIITITFIKCNNDITSFLKPVLATLLTTCLFSYPMQRIELISIFIVLIGILNNNKQQRSIAISGFNYKIIRVLFSISIILCIASGSLLLKSNYNWKRTYEQYRNGKLDFMSMYYNRLYPVLRSDGYYLFNYAAIMTKVGQHQKSITLLKE